MKLKLSLLLFWALFGAHFSTISSYNSSPDADKVMVQKFLVRLTMFVDWKDYASISDMFQPDFSFKHCETIYSKQQVVDYLFNLPADTHLHCILTHVEYNGRDVNFDISAPGLGANGFEAGFALNPSNQKLEMGNLSGCVDTRGRGNGFVKSFL